MEMNHQDEFDVVVIGSGAGGAPVAYELAQKGARVLILEKGPRHTTKDFLHDEVAICRRNFFVPLPGDDPHTLRRSPDEKSAPGRHGWISQCVGGGTVHMSGFFFRFHPQDFALKTHYSTISQSTVIDWPLGYTDLEPFYEKVENIVGVSGDLSANPYAPPRKNDFPYPPVLTHPVSKWIDTAGAKLGMHPFEVPRAIITKPTDGRQACMYCSLCGSYGCEVDAKSSTLASLIPQAEKTGRCEVRPQCMVHDIVMMQNGRAKGVVYTDAKGQPHEVSAKVVVVACSAIESARLLLLSRSSKHPNGLGNNQGQVGKNLCFSTLGQVTGDLRYADFSKDEVASLKSTLPFVGRAFQDFHHVPQKNGRFGKGGMFHLLWEHPNPIYAAENLIGQQGHSIYGADLMKKMAEHFKEGRTLEAECFSEWLPTEGCFVDLDPDITDRWGLPAARINIARHPSDRAASELLVEKARTVLGELGCRNIQTRSVGAETLVLQNGTCRMGNRPQDSVTTKNGNLHEVENVYVTDGASLPTSGSVPLTMTIMANSFRIANQIIKAHT